MAWNTDSTANRFIKSYVQDFIDISGSLTLREKSNLNVNGSTTINGNLFLNNVSLLADLSFNKRIFVGGDCSINGNLTSLGDISINGAVTSCLFKNSSIPQTAFAGPISAPGPDYTKPSVFYEQKFKADADISLNGNIVQINNININGNVKLSDATLMNKYDDNLSKLFDVSSAYISSLCFTKSPNFFSTAPDDVYQVNNFFNIRISASGKIIAIFAGGNGYHAGVNAPNSNDPIGNWNNYSKFGVYISRDFGNTWTKYLVPYENETKMGFSYTSMAMSIDGKHMIITVTPNGNNTNGLPSGVAFSHDYGYTWSSIRYPVYNIASGSDYRADGCCLSNDGRKMMASNQGSIRGWQVSIDYGLSWNTKPATAFAGGFGSNALPKGNADLTKLVIIGGGEAKFYVCTLDNNLNQISYITVDILSARDTLPARTNSSYVNNVMVSNDFKTILFTYYGTASTSYIELYDGITNTWRSTTPDYTSISGSSSTTMSMGFILKEGIVMSRSGKYIFIAGGTESPKLWEANFISSDYGYTFSIVPQASYPFLKVYAIFDDGSFLTMNGGIINIFKPNIYKASRFTTLNLTGNLVAGSFPTASDYRIKTDIATLDPTFTVDNLRPVKYLQTLINKTRYGVIAHELQLYYPDLVVGEKDGEELQNVNYTGLIAILINEIKRLKQEVVELENEV